MKVRMCRVLRMREGDWLEVCDGRGLIVEAQLKGLNYAQQAFATAMSEAVEVDSPQLTTPEICTTTSLPLHDCAYARK